ncbi:MAG TPA: hypothetical protein VFF73_31895 [Planctomycetota bacterium]|nr:hypothetical protein [Planctomycetota bacterium]
MSEEVRKGKACFGRYGRRDRPETLPETRQVFETWRLTNFSHESARLAARAFLLSARAAKLAARAAKLAAHAFLFAARAVKLAARAVKLAARAAKLAARAFLFAARAVNLAARAAKLSARAAKLAARAFLFAARAVKLAARAVKLAARAAKPTAKTPGRQDLAGQPLGAFAQCASLIASVGSRQSAKLSQAKTQRRLRQDEEAAEPQRSQRAQRPSAGHRFPSSLCPL